MQQQQHNQSTYQQFKLTNSHEDNNNNQNTHQQPELTTTHKLVTNACSADSVVLYICFSYNVKQFVCFPSQIQKRIFNEWT